MRLPGALADDVLHPDAARQERIRMADGKDSLRWIQGDAGSNTSINALTENTAWPAPGSP